MSWATWQAAENCLWVVHFFVMGIKCSKSRKLFFHLIDGQGLFRRNESDSMTRGKQRFASFKKGRQKSVART